MLEQLFSVEGQEKLKAALSGDAELVRLAQGWTVRVALVLEKDNRELHTLSLALADGRLQSLGAVAGPPAPDADYVLAAPEGVWKAVLAGQMDPVAAVFTGKLQVKQGNVMSLASRVPALRRLMQLAKEAVASS